MSQTCARGHLCSTSKSQGAVKPFSCANPRQKLTQLQHRQAIATDRRCVIVQCVAPNTEGPGRRVLGGVATAAVLTWALRSASAKSMKPGEVQKRSKEEEQAIFDNREGEIHHTDAEWKSMLSSGAYRVLRKEGTELPLSSPLDHEKRKGTYKCAGCGSLVYESNAKFDSGTGWPSFFQPIDGAVQTTVDRSIPFVPRIEVRCKRCQSHLGHVFDDGPPPTGKRYCMNGVAMTFTPQQA